MEFISGLLIGIMISKVIYQWKFESDVAYDYDIKGHTRIGNRIYKLESFEEIK